MSDYDRRDKIEFLVKQKFPSSTIIKTMFNIAQIGNGEVDKTDDYLEIEKYENELKSKSDEELNNLHYSLKRKLELQHRKNFVFYRIDTPDYEYWSKLGYWNIEEAIALTFDKDPNKLTYAVMANAEKEYSNNYDYVKYIKRKEIILRAVEVGKLQEKIEPFYFVEWAFENEIPVPLKLYDLVIEKSGLDLNYKEKFYAIQEQYNKEREAFKNEIEKLCEELEHLKSRKYEKSKRDNQLYKIIISLAIKYGFNPNNKKQDSTSKIIDLVNKAGLEISDNNVREIVKEAYDRFAEDLGKIENAN